MKITWGTGIFIFIVIFLVACGIFLYYSRTQVWSMVEEDYYPKELRHEEKLVKMRNANALTPPMAITLGAGTVDILFPASFRGKVISGDIHVYRPSDETGDFHVKIQPDTALTCQIPFSDLKHGKYVIKVDWMADSTAYYQEQTVFIP
jgi:nitrogen fixation protein FixH